MNPRQQVFRYALLVISFAVSALVGFFWYAQYFKWRNCFDEQGRCFDATSGTVYAEQSGIALTALLIFTVTGTLVAAFSIFRPNTK